MYDISNIQTKGLDAVTMPSRPGDQAEAEQGFTAAARRSSDHAGHGLSGATEVNPARRGSADQLGSQRCRRCQQRVRGVVTSLQLTGHIGFHG